MGGAQGAGRVSLPRWRQTPGTVSASHHLGVPEGFLVPSRSPPAPSDPGPQPGRVGLKVSVAVGVLKTLTGFLLGRSRTGAQCCPTSSSDGETEARRGGT